MEYEWVWEYPDCSSGNKEAGFWTNGPYTVHIVKCLLYTPYESCMYVRTNDFTSAV